MVSVTLLVAALFVSTASGAEPDHPITHFTGRCVGVYAGDALSIMRDGKAVTVLLDGVSCPSMGEDLGLEAARRTYRLAAGRELSVTVVRRGRNDRLVGVVSSGGHDLAVELVRAGLAAHRWAERPHARLAEAQSLAQEEGRGIWSSTRGLVEVEVERAPPSSRDPLPQRLTEISGGELTDQNVVQDDIVWIWSASSQPADPDDTE